VEKTSPDQRAAPAFSATDALCLISADGRIVYASDSTRAVLGWEPHEIVGRPVTTIVHPEQHAELMRSYARLRRTGDMSCAYRCVHKDGGDRWVACYAMNCLDEPHIRAAVVNFRRATPQQPAAEIEARMRQIVSQMPVAVWTTDRNLIVTTSLGGDLPLLGYQPDELVGMSLFDLFAGKRDDVIDTHRRALAGERMELERKWRDRQLFVRMQPLLDCDSEIAGTLGVAFDVTDTRRAEERFRSLFERNVAGVFRSTVGGRLVECNDAFVKIFGYDSARDMLEIPTSSLYVDTGDRAELIATLKKQKELINFERRLRRRDGSVVWALLNETLVRGDSGEEDTLEGTIIDITARKMAEERMQYLAFHDALTGLPNRSLLNDRLTMTLARARRHGQLAAVLFLDLDQFKLINDTMAHPAGDELLRGLADRLSNALRSEDTVARIGGDEFVFIIPDIDMAAAAARTAERILASVRRPFEIQRRELYVTASMGVAIFPHDGDDAATLIKNADSAMYRAKELGRNMYQFHMPVTQRRAELRLTLETALRHALDREEFFLVYQPIIDLSTGRIRSFEALLRWNRGEHGVIEPNDFIPLAEEIGSIVPIGAWAMREACRQAREWQRGGAEVSIAVNLSARQFQDPRLTQLVETVLEETDLPSRLLELEITESLAMRDSDMTYGRLSHFRNLGIRVALDDFGSGYSSLSHLQSLPIDTIKVDRSFIVGLSESAPERAIVQAIVTMAQALRLRVVAEGVETDEQHRVLRAIGCNDVQGFLFDRPLRADVATARLTK